MRMVIYLLLTLFSVSAVLSKPDQPDLIIWDDAPAAAWDVAYPVGNGRLGAMPFAGFPRDYPQTA